MKKIFIPAVLALFAVSSAALYWLWYSNNAFQLPALMVGNIIMAILCIVSYFIVVKQIASRPQAFVRGVSGASLLKLLVCMAGVLTYVLVYRPNVHKPSIFVLLGIYAAYSTIETIILSKWAREVKG